MIIKETRLPGAFIIELDTIEDERGFFARTFCAEEFMSFGLNPKLVQCSISFNKKKNTLRGMHYQSDPYAEDKLVRCTMGAIYDVIIDIRPESSTYKQWFSVELSAENRKQLYIPKGMAHGFQTLEDNTEVYYQISEYFHPEYSRGIRWNDPVLGIVWPMTTNLIISEKDSTYPHLK